MAGNARKRDDIGEFHDFRLAIRRVAITSRGSGAVATLRRAAATRRKVMPRILEEPKPRRPAYFWWLLINAVALCLAVISWFVCLDIFKHIEVPRNYELLRKLHRLPTLQAYAAADVPSGNGLGPKELYHKFFGSSAKDQERFNGLLLRNYLTNFQRPALLTYIEGDYQVTRVRVLGAADFFNPGFVIRAQALVKPDEFTVAAPYPVHIEYMLPTADVAAAAYFKSGDVLGVRKSPNYAAVVHVGKLSLDGESALLLTVIPIVYGAYQIGSVHSFDTKPPVLLRLGATFPMFGN